MRQRGGSELARANQRVIIGPWTHIDFSGSFPDREFGPTASAAAINLPGIQLRWFDRWLRGAHNWSAPGFRTVQTIARPP